MSTLSFSDLSKEDECWVDELIGELVDQEVLQEFSCLRRLLTDLRFKGSSDQGCILLYFLTTLHTVLGYTESQDAITYYQILAEKYQSAFNTPATSNSEKFTDLMKACMKGNEDEYESCKTEYIQQLISEDKFNDANIFIVQYRLYKQGIECYETRLEGLSPCKSEIETSTNIFKFRNSLFIKFLEYLDSGVNTETIEDILTQIRKVDCSPKGVVVVDASCKRRYENGVIYVNDLKAGLQISQNGGRLLIKNGDYTADAWHDVKLLKDGATLEIIGESSSDCCLSGSIKILACPGGKISIRNVKLEIGDSAESNDAMNILGGWVNFDTCVLECFVNTAIYIHSRPDGVLTAVNMKNCFIEGLQSCQRIFSIEQGVNTSLTLNSCYINETYSVLSWFNDKKAENVHVSISNCFINDIQDVLRVVLNEVSNVSVHLEKTSFNLVLYSEEENSTAITLPNQVDLQFSRNMTVLNHTQGVGVCITVPLRCGSLYNSPFKVWESV
ncbi:uncharacterized protein LOC111716935 [Eurytemora carolleeae]|uniref:uncharacterized protein LOC111716935 n=1 Tax=Eurytemora carolleeae TaxID=1294199 RepID=UPI000C77F51A|nr:uncharacterized protein LOC111716935 [Eurytemora carolleeae]|eukprot:XP_023348213.1 uncharacterized protein LOC111716935 [Eurytemora affinis]